MNGRIGVVFGLTVFAMSQISEPISLELSADSLRQGEQAIRQDLALQLYAQHIFMFGQARRLADLSVWQFQQLLGQHQIQRNYEEADLLQDAEAIRSGVWQR